MRRWRSRDAESGEQGGAGDQGGAAHEGGAVAGAVLRQRVLRRGLHGDDGRSGVHWPEGGTSPYGTDMDVGIAVPDGTQDTPADGPVRFPTACPTRVVLSHVTSRWGVLVLLALRDGPVRWGALRRTIEG